MHLGKKNLSITTFFGLIFLAIFSIITTIAVQEFININTVKNLASDTKQKQLPQFTENQKTLANIESLRRMAEVSFVTNDSGVRRNSRISAQSISSESLFESDSSFRTAATLVAQSILQLSRIKDKVALQSKNIRAMMVSHNQSLEKIIWLIGSSQDHKKNLNLLDNLASLTFEPVLPVTGFSKAIQQRIKELTEHADRINKLAQSLNKLDPKLQAEIMPLLAEVKHNIEEFIIINLEIENNSIQAEEKWKEIDISLRSMRDKITTGSEQIIAQALTGIENTAVATKSSSLTMYLALFVVFVIYSILFYFFITKPLHWTSKKLSDIQKGTLKSNTPRIYIKEISDVAILLDHFSEHLADLYSQTTQLTEDVAIKRDLEEIMRAVFKASLDGYVVWNKETVEKASQGVLQLLDIESEEKFANYWNSFGLSSQYLDKVLSTTANSGFDRSEIVLTTTHGEHLPCEATNLPITFHNKPCILTYIRDLRVQKRNEEALLQAKELAEVATQEKSNFLARMSHEIRTPMNGVLGLTHLALQSSPTPQQQNLLSKIQSSAKILLGVINDILDFSKIDSGNLELEKTPFALNSILTTIGDLLIYQAQDKGLSFEIEYDQKDKPNLNIIGDSLRLSQILLNLSGNAIKFTEQGAVKVAISTIAESDDNITLKFAVSDSGIGITEEQMPQLFQPFKQADSSTTRKHGGTGLGLMISKLLVELMGGKLEVQSTINKGSVFYFTLSCEKLYIENDTKQELLAEKDENILSGKRILVAEDNMINQEIIEALLENFGIIVTLADNGEEAVNILKTQNFDGILLDIQMPIMDGLTAATLIRKEGRAEVCSLPIIAMTAHAMQEDIAKSLEAGMNAHLTKPIDIEALEECLVHWLK